MKVHKVLRHDTTGNEITIWLGTEDRQRYEFTASADVALQIALAIRDAARRVADRPADISRGVLYTLVACQPIFVDGQCEGLALKTLEGFEIPLLLDSAAREVLRDGLDQLDHGIVHEGPVH